jgi:1,2-diacylglycerol 3-alpha-glucosyltransferase
VKRICIISIFKDGDGGGEGMAAYELARVLSKNYQVRLLCPGSTTGNFEENGLKEFRVKSYGDKNLYVPLLSQNNVREIFNFLDDFSPDVVHAHDPALLGVIGQFWARVHNVPFFYTAHVLPLNVLEFGTSEFIKLPPGLLSGALAERFLLNFYDNCDAVIALNKNASEQIAEFGFAGLVFPIPNGRNVERFTHCEIADIRSPAKILTFIGFLNHRKNQVYLIEMMKYLPKNYQLWLIGEPLIKDYGDELKRVAKEQGVEDNVKFVGAVPAEAIPDFLEKSHLLVSASKLEVQSLVVIEALASGTPVVGLSNETVDELVHPDNGVRLEKDTSPEAFAAEVKRICNSTPEKYAAMCAAAREAVIHQDWSIVSQSIVAAYEKVIIHNHLAVKLAPDIDRLYRIIEPMPAGQLRSFLQRQILDMAVKRAPNTKIDSKTRLFIGLTIYGSIVVYYFLKGPLAITRKIIAKFQGEK